MRDDVDRGVAEPVAAAVVKEELLQAKDVLAVDPFAAVDLIVQVVDRRRTLTSAARGRATILIMAMANGDAACCCVRVTVPGYEITPW